MTNIKDLKIYIVEYVTDIADVFKEVFKGYQNIIVENDDLFAFYADHRDEIDGLVSPANAYGHMDGGFDARLSDILGRDFQLKVQKYIKDHFYGEQLVGTSFIIKTDISHLWLIHTPTMQHPSRIDDDFVVYQAMRSTLMCALEHNIKCIVIPVFGGACGGVAPERAASRMLQAYKQILNYGK